MSDTIETLWYRVRAEARVRHGKGCPAEYHDDGACLCGLDAFDAAVKAVARQQLYDAQIAKARGAR